ncbi:MAG: hypothetical protein HRK26_02925 [Rickettsiaceae bacterium H1]|nr:hypothetical protein [Rickettsiaceae bacterium H1]
MTTLSYVNHNSNLASSHLKNSISGIENAIKRLASGEKFANIGEGVSERSVASSLSNSLSALKVGKSNVGQALSILNAGSAVMNDTFNILNRQRELSMQAASDTMTDQERIALNLDYQTLIQQIKDNANFEYNGMKLLDGSYSDTAKINTYQGKHVIKVFDDINQFVETGNIGENPLLKTGSQIEAVQNVGKTAATATIDLSGIKNGGTITIKDKTFFTVANPVNLKDPTRQFMIGTNDTETIQNLVKLLNSSDFSEISQHSYRLGDKSNLEIIHNQVGFEGNYSTVEVKIVGGSNNGEFVLKGGKDLRERATAMVKFEQDNYKALESITLNGEKFNFKPTDKVVLSTDVAVGNNIDETLSNLVTAVRNSNGTANQAVLEYDSTNNMLKIISKEAGLVGNSYSFNFGNGSAKYSYEEGRVGDNKPFTATIEGLVNGVDLSDHTATTLTGTKISTDELTFDQAMQGTFSDAHAVFKAGKNLDQDGKFEANKVQFMAYLGGELYKTNDIALSGGNKTGNIVDGTGYHGLGNKIAGGTKLIFQQVGAKDTDIGFQVTVKDEGITLRSNTLDGLQQELNIGAQHVVDAMKLGGVKLNVVGASYTIEDFGLNNVEQFFAAGEVKHSVDNTLNSNLTITNKVGATKAQGTIKFVKNVEKGDQIDINGTIVTFGKDIDLSGSTKSSRDNLLQYLNSSTDANISQAIYYAYDDDGNNQYSIVIQNKEAGTVGNSFRIGTNSTDSINLNDLKLSETTLGVTDITQAGSVQEGTKASVQMKIHSNFNGSEHVSLYVYTPGYAYTYNFTIIGETSNVDDTSDTVIKIKGATNSTEVADQITAGINNYINNNLDSKLHQLEFNVVGENVQITSKEPGKLGNRSYLRSYSPTLISDTTGNQYIWLKGGTDTSNQTVTPGKNVVAGTDIKQGLKLPITETLQGSITNLNGVFHEGSVHKHVKGKFEANNVTFSANIGGKVYTGNVSLSSGSILDGKAQGTNYNRLGDTISAGTKIVLSGDDKSHAVALSVNKDIDLSGKTKLEVLNKLNAAIIDMSNELSKIEIYQKRNLSNINEAEVDGTVLQGIKQNNIYIAGANFANDGNFKISVNSISI